MKNRSGDDNTLIMRIAEVISALFVLNVLTVLCCIPIITTGAALTALHDGLIRIIRKEDGYIAKRFFEVFRANLKTGTILWLPFLLIFSGAAADVFIELAAPGLLSNHIKVIAAAAGLLTLYCFQWIFPVNARFKGDVHQVFRTAFLLAGVKLPRTLAMTMMWIIPVAASRFLPSLPLVLAFGISLPAMLGALFYYPVFAELESDPDEVSTGNNHLE
ncbi:MAG: YesL family protein [Lachnospiraceae bacterium]|nr:YesL family protein [Lachnospiraceae bacterium]